jgi:hypothetical protein
VAGPPYPLGYSLLVAALDVSRLPIPASLVLVNCAFIALALWSLARIAHDRPREVVWLATLLTLFSYLVVRSVAMPLPEAIYLGLSLSAVAAMNEMQGRRGREGNVFFAAAIVFIALAAAMRLAAVTLLPALFWSAATRFGSADGPTRRISPGPLEFVAVTAALAAVGAVLMATQAGTLARYGVEMFEALGERQLHLYLADRVPMTLQSLGELTVNLPLGKFHWMRPGLPAVGAATAFVLFRTRRTPGWTPPVLLYIGANVAMIAAWPYYAPRLWLPLIPLLMLQLAIAAMDLSRRRSGGRILSTAALAWFAITGLGALAYSTRISFAGDRFSSWYGRAGGLASPRYQETNHNDRALVILQRYDPGSVTRELPAKARPDAPLKPTP